jgi:hypothetical protein
MLELLADQSILVFFIFFIIFIVIAYKFVKFLFKAFIIGLVAAMFPIVGTLFLGLNIDITVFNIIWFAVTGVGLYLVYNVVRGGWKFVKLMTAPFRWILRPSHKEKKSKETKD